MLGQSVEELARGLDELVAEKIDLMITELDIRIHCRGHWTPAWLLMLETLQIATPSTRIELGCLQPHKRGLQTCPMRARGSTTTRCGGGRATPFV